LTAVILFVSLIGLFMVIRLTTTASKEADRVQLEINALKQREQGLLEAAKSVKAAFTIDQQQALPSAHQLVDRKKFSWSGLLSDLEASLPGNIKVSRIAVQDVTTEGDVTVAQLDLALFAQSASTINAMIASMHQEGVFQLELRNQNLQKGRGESGTEYEFFVIYRPRPGFAIRSVAEVDNTKTKTEVPR
jgi:Tfp pilus assembly protein PilN